MMANNKWAIIANKQTNDKLSAPLEKSINRNVDTSVDYGSWLAVTYSCRVNHTDATIK